jgi:hypothetical protein
MRDKAVGRACEWLAGGKERFISLQHLYEGPMGNVSKEWLDVAALNIAGCHGAEILGEKQRQVLQNESKHINADATCFNLV